MAFNNIEIKVALNVLREKTYTLLACKNKNELLSRRSERTVAKLRGVKS